MTIRADVLRGHTDAVILAQLMRRDSYGYEINKTIESLSGGAFVLKEATLYTAFRRLEDSGLINSFLSALGLPRLHMINTQGAVVLGMVYDYIPFMILPLYSVMSKLDPSVVEAAQDLGADSRRVFLRVTLPLSMPGVISGITMVFVPSVSTFIISKMLGGGANLMIGDLIDMQFLGTAYNPNLGSAISLVLMVLILICMGIMNEFDDGESQGGGMLI